MAENTTQYTSQMPPAFLAQFFQGGRQGIPGIVPLLNQELVNKFATMSVPGATPFTYQGQRIADFTPAEREAMRLGVQGVGSYLPFFQDAESRMRGADLQTQLAGQEGASLVRGAASRGISGLEAGQQLLGQAPSIASDFTGRAAGNLEGGSGMFRPGSLQDHQSNISAFYNPFEQAVVDQSLADIQKSLAKSDIARRAKALGSGAFGGSRSRLLGEELAEAAGRGALERVCSLRAGGFNQALQTALKASEAEQNRDVNRAKLLGGLGQNLAGIYGTAGGGLGASGVNMANVLGGAGRDISNIGLRTGEFGRATGTGLANLGSGLYGMLGQDICRLSGIGAAQRGMQQRGLDLDYQTFVGQYNLPSQLLGGLGGMAASFAPALGFQQFGTTTNPDPNYLTQALGLGAAYYGAQNQGA